MLFFSWLSFVTNIPCFVTYFLIVQSDTDILNMLNVIGEMLQKVIWIRGTKIIRLIKIKIPIVWKDYGEYGKEERIRNDSV